MKTISESIPDLNFIEINREERNHVAILYHLLLSGNNLQKFLKISGITGDYENSEIELFFEYALLRDFWERIKKDDEGNTEKKAYLFTILKDLILDKDKLDSFDTDAFNSYFGAKRAQSKTIIASPANWSIASFDSEILANKDFLKAVCNLILLFIYHVNVLFALRRNLKVVKACIQQMKVRGKYFKISGWIK